MGITFVEGTVTGSNNEKATVRFLVDSGATYSLLPIEVWQQLGLKPKRALQFTLADGTQIERNVSECHITLPQGDGHTPVILGQPIIFTTENTGNAEKMKNNKINACARRRVPCADFSFDNPSNSVYHRGRVRK
ncbi:MAG: retroviral-like aspartic protease [Chloroflexi bacterium]|nr:retroviral-like aspartic protease [Chloroflexota bacterium]